MSAGAGSTRTGDPTRPRRRGRSAPGPGRCDASAPDLPRELTATIDAALQTRRSRRPTLEELGTAIEDSLDQLAENPPRRSTALPLRAGVAAAAAVLGALLAVGHGIALP